MNYEAILRSIKINPSETRKTRRKSRKEKNAKKKKKKTSDRIIKIKKDENNSF